VQLKPHVKEELFDYPFCFFRQEKAEKVERVESSALENQRRLLSHAQLELASR
jgi:hypothetical protein